LKFAANREGGDPPYGLSGEAPARLAKRWRPGRPSRIDWPKGREVPDWEV